MNENLLAVYGSLRMGFGLHGIPDQRSTRLIDRGRCVIRGLLYDLGAYPGMIEGDGRVIGELVEVVDSGALRMLDEYEGFDVTRPAESHFIRRSLRLLEPSIDVWVYIFNGEVTERQLVASGDWAVHMSARTHDSRHGG